MSKQQIWLSAAAVACSYTIYLAHSPPDAKLIDTLGLTCAASIAVIDISGCTVAASSAAQSVGTFSFAVASAVVSRALVHV